MGRVANPFARVGSMFSGIGGLDLGVEQVLAPKVLWQVEPEPYCRAVLARHWPHADRSVLSVLDREQVRALPEVDLLIGGPPCQGFSGAGKMRGLADERSGLMVDWCDFIAEKRIHGVITENVSSGVSRWLPYLDGRLTQAGYVHVPLAISAADVGAPHLRRRVFDIAIALPLGLLAHTHSVQLRVWEQWQPRRQARGVRKPEEALVGVCSEGVADADGQEQLQPSRGMGKIWGRTGHCGDEVADPLLKGLQRGHVFEQESPDAAGLSRVLAHTEGSGREFVWGTAEPDGEDEVGRASAQCRLGRAAHGLSLGLDWPAPRGELQHAFEAPRTIPKGTDKHRRARLKALGNAVVPACGAAAARALLRLHDLVQLEVARITIQEDTCSRP